MEERFWEEPSKEGKDHGKDRINRLLPHLNGHGLLFNFFSQLSPLIHGKISKLIGLGVFFARDMFDLYLGDLS